MRTLPTSRIGTRRTALSLAALTVATAVGLPAAGAFGAPVAAAGVYHPVYAGAHWEEALQVPGLAALDPGGNSAVTSLSCGAIGDCAAGGFTTSAGQRQAFLVNESAGSWGSAATVPGLAQLGVSAQLVAVSCAAAGSCTAGGNVATTSGHDQPFVVTEAAGQWGTASVVPGLQALDPGGNAWLVGVSCAFAGDCSATGTYDDPSAGAHPFVVDEVDGTWGDASAVPGVQALAGTAGVPTANPRSISCGAPGDCSSGGLYVDATGAVRAYVVDEVDRVWGDAIEVPGTAALSNGGGAYVNDVSCAASGACSAVGEVTVAGPCSRCTTPVPFVVDEVGGTWGKAALVRGVGAIGYDGELYAATLLAVACASPGSCSAGGDVESNPYESVGLTVDEVDGVWGAAHGSATAVVGFDDESIDAVSCTVAGACVGGGSTSFVCTPGPDGCGTALVSPPFVDSEVGGRWEAPTWVPGHRALEAGDDAGVTAVSCPALGRCSAGGYVVSPSGAGSQAFVVDSSPLVSQQVSLAAPGAGGVGTHLVLSAHATSGLSVRLSLAPRSVGCALRGRTLYLQSVGRCLVDATQAGDATYATAPTVRRAIFSTQSRVITGFARNSAALSALAHRELEAIEASWPGGSVTRIVVLGDANPGAGAVALSQRRADVVEGALARWLHAELFAAPIHAVGRGASTLVARAGAHANDRVVIRLS